MSPDDPRHGTHAGALAHYREGGKPCGPCAVAQFRFTKASKLRLLEGQLNRIPLGEKAYLILDLYGCTEVARVTGLSRSNLYRLYHLGPDCPVIRGTRDAILTAAPAYTPVGIQRRLRALAALGWCAPEIAAAAGVHREPLVRIRRGKFPPVVVKSRFAIAVCRAYDTLHMHPAPSNRHSLRTRRMAARLGWAPPFAYDDIDNPNEEPQGVLGDAA